jgi:putative oxidoreductase
MAWNPFHKSAPEAPTLVMRPVEVPVADATMLETPAAPVAPQSENLRLAFEAAQREADAEQSLPAPEVAAPASAAPPRFGGATRFEAAPVVAEPTASEVTPASAWAPVAVAVAPAVLAADEPTQVMDVPARTVAVSPSDEATSVEQARLERERAARREARMAALEPVREDDPLAPVVVPAATPAKPVKRVTDRFLGSLGLFALRLVTAAILFVHGLNGIINPKPVDDLWSNTVLPYSHYVAVGVSIAEVALAILLVFGLLTRLAGLGILAIMGATLAFVMWGSWSVFEPGGMGFIGEHELLLGAVGLLFLLVGAGGWSVDYMVRRNRLREGLQH